MSVDNTLFLIPARGGSKGIPKKNIKHLNGIPLLAYTLQYARAFTSDEHIFLSTDDEEIAQCARQLGLEIDALRPVALAQDATAMSEVVHHALESMSAIGREYEYLCLLQPTSPLRYLSSLKAAYARMNANTDMVMGVKAVQHNPFYLLYEEDEHGSLKKALPGLYANRQSAPRLYEVNGALYLFKVSSLQSKGWSDRFDHIEKLVMDPMESVDIDGPIDWAYCEFLMTSHWPGMHS